MFKTSSQNLARMRYDRMAFLYDFIEAPLERFRFAGWRARLRDRISGRTALEAGVGTGKNTPYYPDGVKIIAIDLSPRMLKRAHKKVVHDHPSVELLEMDAQQLAFPDNSFDTVFGTFVFCSVPDPVAGLRELRRVCKPDGRLLLLEHMRPESSFAGMIFDLLNPIVVRMVGANINRRTVENIRTAGWHIQVEEKLSADIVRWIEAV
ncbi:MAG: class I SAM-dependent methyltransferase [Deltaproteobacteria bacterium]|nr:class I SAM-dependent methyltransferase [Deltaproteobacteria bacterium]MBW2152653.1 class I SAM-dependent methyltransferase [Deltaproteobacteria bacterium]